MNLYLHGSMGDHLVATGIPEAFYNYFGEKTYVEHQYSPLFWKNNPYISQKPLGKINYSLFFNGNSKDYMIYYPVRIFFDITGWIVSRHEVQPNIYFPREIQPDMVLVNDQAGWPTRRGYPYFQDLVWKLKQKGYRIVYLRNEGYRDCNGKESPRVINTYDQEIRNPPMQHLIDTMRSSALYIGYDSGLSQLAGALKVPYVLLEGSVAPINTAHDSCIYALEVCRHCNLDNCSNMCLAQAPNKNEEILEAIGKELVWR